MTGHVISQVEVLDEGAAEQYRKLAASSIATYGRTYLVQGARADVLEGEETSERIVVLQFSSMQALGEWYRSPE
jgi:uncharacterized protein (DUF1330 family)